MVIQEAGDSQGSHNLVQVSTSVPTYVLKVTPHGTLGLTTAHVRVLAEERYDTQWSVLYWKFTDIKEWCQLKDKIPEIRGGIYFRNIKIKWLQSLAWWVADLNLRSRNVDLTNFKSAVLSDAIKESWLDFEDTIDSKGELSNLKYFSH